LTCRDGCCETVAKVRRHVKLTKKAERYGRLWAELELPELLEKETEKP
jgi:hypothetical protein